MLMKTNWLCVHKQIAPSYIYIYKLYFLCLLALKKKKTQKIGRHFCVFTFVCKTILIAVIALLIQEKKVFLLSFSTIHRIGYQLLALFACNNIDNNRLWAPANKVPVLIGLKLLIFLSNINQICSTFVSRWCFSLKTINEKNYLKKKFVRGHYSSVTINQRYLLPVHLVNITIAFALITLFHRWIYHETLNWIKSKLEIYRNFPFLWYQSD